MVTTLSFTLSPDRDTATITGYASIEASSVAPAPVTTLLLGSGLLGLAVMRRKLF
jgi:hypothetical protein